MKEAKNLKFLVESSEMRVHILVKRLANSFSFVVAPNATFILQLMTSNLTWVDTTRGHSGTKLPTRLKFTLSRLSSLFVGNSKYWPLSIFVKTDSSPRLIKKVDYKKKNALTDKSFLYVMTFSFTIIPFLYLNILMPSRSYGTFTLLPPSM